MKEYECLRKLGKKTITKEDLHRVLAKTTDEALFPLVEALVAQGILQPVKASRTNGNQRYPLYLRYRICLEQEHYEAERDEIGRLHPLLQRERILMDRPAGYRRYRTQIQQLDRYLFRREMSPVPVSRKERSFEIFGEEKQLDDRSFCRLLDKLGLGRDALYFYDTPEYCFNDYIPERKSFMTLLICENKDIWFNIRRRMFEDGAAELLGVHIDGVVYGCGNKVSQKEALTSYTRFMGGAEVRYLYWGDIDRAGLNIYLSLIRNNPDVHIQLFLPAYEEMLRLSRNVTVPDSEDGRKLMEDYGAIYRSFAEESRSLLKQYITDNKRLPQEIVSYARLREVMR